MQPIGAAVRQIVAAFTTMPTERVLLGQLRGRTLAEDVHARRDSPSAATSAMDGYAVRGVDVRGATSEHPVRLRVVATSRAGAPSSMSVSAGEACRVFTGALLPAGTDTVVAQEDTTAEDAHVAVRFAVPTGGHVRLRGDDACVGELVVCRGSTVGPGEIGWLASQGVTEVRVHARPRVAILSTGDELRPIDVPLATGDVASSSAFMVAALVEDAGGEPWIWPDVPDDREATARALSDAFERADVVLTCGGVSVGDHDFVRGALGQLGVELALWRVRMKPGKPVAFATHRGRPIVALPGNPVSSFVAFELFVRPGLRAMAGSDAPYRPRVVARTREVIRHSVGRTEFLRGRLGPPRQATDPPEVRVFDRQASSALTSLVGADALVIAPHDRSEWGRGELIDVLSLSEGRGATEPSFGSDE